MAIPKLIERKLITCILPSGKGAPLLAALKAEQEVITANMHHGRGVGSATRLDGQSLGDQTEKDILSVVISAQRADELFGWLHAAAEVDRPHGGVIFQSRLGFSTPFELPDIGEETGA